MLGCVPDVGENRKEENPQVDQGFVFIQLWLLRSLFGKGTAMKNAKNGLDTQQVPKHPEVVIRGFLAYRKECGSRLCFTASSKKIWTSVKLLWSSVLSFILTMSSFFFFFDLQARVSP